MSDLRSTFPRILEAQLSSTIDGTRLPPAAHPHNTFARRLAYLAPWIVSLWLIGLTAWYVTTVVRSLNHPLNKGDDLKWAWIWVGFAALVVATHLSVRRRWVTIVWLALLGGIALAMIILSHSVIGALITAWLLILSWLWGDWALRILGLRREPPTVDRTVVAVPLGLTFLGLIALAICTTRGLTPKLAWSVFPVLTLIQARSLFGLFGRFRRLLNTRREWVWPKIEFETGIIIVWMGFIFLSDLSWALAPEIHYDALSAHLPIARYYAGHPMEALAYGYVANLADLFFTIGLSLWGQIVVKLLVLSLSVLSALVVFALGRALFTARVGLWAAALFFSIPLVSWLSSTAYVDAIVTAFLASTLLAFFKWRAERSDGWLWASGLLAGAAIAIKLNSLLGLPFIGLLLLWDIFRSRVSVSRKLKSIAGYVACIVLVSAPGFAAAYWLAGNPIYPLPLLGKLLGSSGSSGVSLITNSKDFGMGTSLSALLSLPVALTFETRRFGEALPGGTVGLALLLVPLALVTIGAAKPMAAHAAILAMVSVTYLLCLAFIMQYARYYVPVLPVIVILATSHLAHPTRRFLLRANLVVLGIVVIAQTALFPLMYWNIPERLPIALDLGKESQEAFLSRVLPVYGAVRHLNASLVPDQKVIGLGADHTRFYVDAEMGSRADVEVITLASTPATLAETLIEKGYAYMLVNRADILTAIPLSCLTPPFLDQYTNLEYSANNVSIYRLQSTPIGERQFVNLLPNSSFENLDSAQLPSGWWPIGRPRLAQSASEAHTGVVSVLADAGDGLFAVVPVQANVVYTVAHWTRSDLPGQFARLQINWMDAQTHTVGVSIEVIPVLSGWEWHRLSAVAPEGAVSAVVYLSVHETSQVWFDDLSFVQGQLVFDRLHTAGPQ